MTAGRNSPGRWGPWVDELAPFQRRFLDDCQPGRARITAISVARGNGKSFLMGLVGVDELTERGGDIYLIAAAYKQAQIVFRDVVGFLVRRFGEAAVYDKNGRWVVRDNMNVSEILDKKTGGHLRAVGALPKLSHGWRPALIICDEPAQWQVGGEALYSAALTSLGKVPGSRMVIGGTRAASLEHFFSRLLDSDDRDIAKHIYAGDPNATPVLGWRNLHKANPIVRSGLLPSLRGQIEFEVRQAKADKAAHASLRALRLNLGESDIMTGALLVGSELWREVRARPVGEPAGPFVIGFDLGGTRSLSSAAAFFVDTGRLECLSATGGIPDLVTRGHEDRVGNLYQLAAEDGELMVFGGQRIPDAAGLMWAALQQWGEPAAVFADRWRIGEMEDVAQSCGLYFEYQHSGGPVGAESVARFRWWAQDGALNVARPCRLLDWAMGSARVRDTVVGDVILDTRRKYRGARDDPAAAAVLAVGNAHLLNELGGFVVL